MEKIAAFIGLLLLLSGFVMLVISINRGKKMVSYLKQRYPLRWEEMGKPTPGYLNSLRRHRWTRFIQQQEYLHFDDSKLKEMGEAQRNLEKITLGFVMAFVIGFGGLVLWLEFAG